MTVVLALAATPVMGQDLLARQAPIDRKMKAVDVPVSEPVNKFSKKILLFKNLPPLLIKKFFMIGFIAKFTLCTGKYNKTL